MQEIFLKEANKHLLTHTALRPLDVIPVNVYAQTTLLSVWWKSRGISCGIALPAK